MGEPQRCPTLRPINGHSVGEALAVLVALALGATGCAAPVIPSHSASLAATAVTTPVASSPTPAVAQRIVCGTVPHPKCEAIAAEVARDMPNIAGSPLVVMDFGGAEVKAHYGSNDPVLVAFQAVGNEDFWMNPPTWVYTESQQDATFGLIQEWRVGSLPADFVALLRTAGLNP